MVGLDGVRAEIAMLETPGHGRLELTKFHAPPGRGGDRHAPANTPGIRHVAFAVDDIDAVVATCEPATRSSLARWSATKTAIGSATSAARRGSSSSWRSRSAEGSGRPPTASPASSRGRIRLLHRAPSRSWPVALPPDLRPAADSNLAYPLTVRFRRTTKRDANTLWLPTRGRAAVSTESDPWTLRDRTEMARGTALRSCFARGAEDRRTDRT